MGACAGSAPCPVRGHGELPQSVAGSEALANPDWQRSFACLLLVSPLLHKAAAAAQTRPQAVPSAQLPVGSHGGQPGQPLPSQGGFAALG